MNNPKIQFYNGNPHVSLILDWFKELGYSCFDYIELKGSISEPIFLLKLGDGSFTPLQYGDYIIYNSELKQFEVEKIMTMERLVKETKDSISRKYRCGDWDYAIARGNNKLTIDILNDTIDSLASQLIKQNKKIIKYS